MATILSTNCTFRGNGVTLDPVDDSKGLAPLVAELIQRCHKRSRMDFANFALAMSQVLGRTVHRTEVSRWEHGHMVPRADVLLAALAVAGFDPFKLGEEEDPADVLLRVAARLRS